MEKAPYPIRVQLVENSLINEAGLQCLLESEADITVLQHVQCQSVCNHLCVNHNPDVLLMAMNPTGQCGIECVHNIVQRYPRIRILTLCMREDPYLARRLIDIGVKGVVCNHTPPQILLRAIREIAAGNTYIDTHIAQTLATLGNEGESTPFASLTTREFEIMRLLLNGMNQKEIGEHLFISPHTVANHHTNMMRKLHISNPIELTRLAIRHNIISAE